MTPLTIVVSTAIYLVVAAIVYALIGRFSRRQLQVFRIVAIVALLLSFAMPLSAMQLTPPAGATIVAVLRVMHILAAIITVSLFTTLARASGEATL
jgi:hypothetical protein